MKRSVFRIIAAALCTWSIAAQAATIKVAIDAEFGLPQSTSAQAVRNGAQVAVNEINAAGGVLGRKLELIERDNRSVPARSINNLRELAADPDVVAVMCARFSPVVVEVLPELAKLQLPLLDPWAAADAITQLSDQPSYAFRLSVRDSWALQTMMKAALKRGFKNVGFLAPNTEWGRSSLRAAQATAMGETHQSIVSMQWYSWGDKNLLDSYKRMRQAGAQAILFVANDREANTLVADIAALPAAERLPLIAHHGLTGGQFFELSKQALPLVDLSFVQTYSFINKNDPVAKKVLVGLKAVTGSDDPRKVVSPIGVAQAYDLVQLLAAAIRKAGNTDRRAVRDALEHLGPYQGLVRHYSRPFSPESHDALSAADVFLARFAEDGAIVPIAPTPSKK